MEQVITRDQQSPEHTWDLSALYESPERWEEDLTKLNEYHDTVVSFAGTLGESPEKLREYLDLSVAIGKLDERLGYYAMLRQSEDAGDSTNQDRFNRYMQVASRISTAMSFFAPELQQLSEETIDRYMEHELLAPYRWSLHKVLRYKPYTLSLPEEKILAMQQEANQTASRSFGALVDVDLEFGNIETPEGTRPLTQSSFSTLLEHQDRSVRQKAFTQFYDRFEAHKNTLTALFTGSVNLDIYRARVRGYDSALASKLFPDAVPRSVYDTLISTVRDSLPTLHRYYELRKSRLALPDFAVYDTRVPLVSSVQQTRTFEEAVDTVIQSLSPLGSEYCDTLRSGLLGGWVDRYENKGKRSGAFSAGSYVGEPYILMNYKDDSVRDMFTLAHEAGHSMHSWYSVRNNPFQHYDYTIFEAEVASTFNEQLLMEHLLQENESGEMRSYLLNKHIDDIIGTLFRQTMFAEFERDVHDHVEGGNALSVDWLRDHYGTLLNAYFGDGVVVPQNLDLEGLRIPHFYRSFYVYKYATGISAAIALSRRVLDGGTRERDEYFAFLKSGGSRFPIDSLRVAGVDMNEPEPIRDAVALFETRVGQLTEALDTA